MRRLALSLVVAAAVILLSACEGSTQQPQPPASSANSTVEPIPSDSPTPAAEVTQPVFLGNVTAIDQPGLYVLDPVSHAAWRIDSREGTSVLWSPLTNTLLRLGPGALGGGINEEQDADVVDLAAMSAHRGFIGYIWHGAWSADGAYLAFGTPEGVSTVRRDGSGLVRLVNVDARGGLAWSPRDDWIATAERYAVRLTTPSAGSPRVISPEAGSSDYLGFSSWAPDGTRLLWCSAPSGGGSKVEAGAYVYDVDIGSTTKVNDNCGLKWGPDSTTLTYASDNDIFIMNADGSGTRQLTEGAVVGGWSSDGAWLSYGTDSCETGDNDIYVVSRDGSTSFKVTNSPESLKESASWSSAMDEIAYSVKLGDTSHALQVVGVDGQPPKTALTSPFHIHAPTWSPDGRILSFTVGGGHGAC